MSNTNTPQATQPIQPNPRAALFQALDTMRYAVAEVVPGLWARVRRVTAVEMARFGYIPFLSVLSPDEMQAALSGFAGLTDEEREQMNRAIAGRLDAAAIQRAKEESAASNAAWACAGLAALRVGQDGDWQEVTLSPTLATDAGAGVIHVRDLPPAAIQAIATLTQTHTGDAEGVGAALTAAFRAGV